MQKKKLTRHFRNESRPHKFATCRYLSNFTFDRFISGTNFHDQNPFFKTRSCKSQWVGDKNSNIFSLSQKVNCFSINLVAVMKLGSMRSSRQTPGVTALSLEREMAMLKMQILHRQHETQRFWKRE